ncbi:MAG: hypothetical protein KDI18_01810, partial [Gammaproteobacteria bacterium]|nr:hypothetical protein [Gammaproteobacteria bacterium]
PCLLHAGRCTRARHIGNCSCVALPPASMQSYDNMKTAVGKVGRGKERSINKRFQAMVSLYLF